MKRPNHSSMGGKITYHSAEILTCSVHAMPCKVPRDLDDRGNNIMISGLNVSTSDYDII